MIKIIRYKFKIGLGTLMLYFFTAEATSLIPTSKLWEQFKSAKKRDVEHTLPDFSYAGYEYSEKPIISTSDWNIFNVKAFGAIANDGLYDDVAIQAAIDAAERSGGGIVQFGRGKYDVSPNQDTNQYISIQSSNILLKGKGIGPNGTTVFVDKAKLGSNANKYYGTPMFKISSPTKKLSDITTLSADAAKGSFNIQVTDPSEFKIGQKIVLWLFKNKEKSDDYFSGFNTGEKWSAKDGMSIREIHTIDAIDGKTIKLREPLHISLKQSYGVRVRSIEMLENVGVEDIKFSGNWPSYGENFIHHKVVNGVKDNTHNYGWTALAMERVHNGWVKNVEFKDLSQCLLIKTSSAVTVSRVLISGKKSHTSINISESYGVLVKDSQDVAGHHHGPGVARRNSGVVYLRYRMAVGQNIDSHGGGPYASLYDNVSNGHFDKNGGAHSAYPHHLKDLVFWNFELKGGPSKYNFWQTHGRNGHTFLQPYFIGLHGYNVDFAEGTYSSNESKGARVYPNSLFEAQLGLRLLPEYKYCCEAGTSKTFKLPVDVAFGAEGQYNFKLGVTGPVTFDESTFGDPAPGAVKSVYYRETSSF